MKLIINFDGDQYHMTIDNKSPHKIFHALAAAGPLMVFNDKGKQIFTNAKTTNPVEKTTRHQARVSRDPENTTAGDNV